ncbi:hypothetical protein XA68_11207 [Ophiocordyceps unilateralis]|uniref:FAD-binding domain-containing protein n=1 Tax=Ophiocordyceps unilateralis TaxID=268505 RepID=A0A2A9PNE8_OPHUN|nr:hypothetical protein XA68_11207 [Ophiocordyceps unilateralis]
MVANKLPLFSLCSCPDIYGRPWALALPTRREQRAESREPFILSPSAYLSSTNEISRQERSFYVVPRPCLFDEPELNRLIVAILNFLRATVPRFLCTVKGELRAAVEPDHLKPVQATTRLQAMAADRVIICGAGVTGLVLAHALKKAEMAFDVYERDEHINARPHGWGITFHWALSYLRKMLDAPTLAAIDDVQVDPEVGRHDTGNFLFLNLASLDVKFRVPPNERRRVNRQRLREALLRGVADHVHWGKRLVSIEPLSGGSAVRAVFADGSDACGRLLVGADGSGSPTRKFLVPHDHSNYRLPGRMIGVAIDLSPADAQPLRDLDPLLFMGCHPDTGHFLWVSVLDTPETNGSRGTPSEHYRVQVIISWLAEDATASPIPMTDADRVAEMKRRAEGFHPRLRTLVDAIPPSTAVTEIALQDWPCHPWDNHDGRVTLMGDAAHAMTMYRGEAANHGILDVWHLTQAIQAMRQGDKTQAEAIGAYETEMRRRAVPAVLLSRQACLDAHHFNRLDEKSALLKRRALQAAE